MAMKFFPKVVAFVYGYEPSGHFIAAKAIAEFCPNDIIKPVFLNLSEIFPSSSNFIVKTYLELIQKTPIIWNYIYDNPLITKTYQGLGIKFPKFYIDNFAKKLIKLNVNTIFSTHAFSSILTSRENLEIHIKNNFALITDIYAHSFWPKNLDKYFVPHYQTYKSLVENGVDGDKIEVVGMPLRKEFYLEYNVLNLKKKLKISPNITFLITGGSKGLGDIIDIVNIFKGLKHKTNLIVFCGSNTKLKKELNKMKYLSNAKIYPVSYVNNPAVYYAVSDAVIGKAGGITIFEASAMKKMFFIYSPLPGQEERNTKFLVSHHCALNPKNLRELKNLIDDYLINRKDYERYINNFSKIHQKDAPQKIVNFIINNL